MEPLGHAPSTRKQYWWAWSQFARFCSHDAVEDYSEEAVAAFIEFVAVEYQAGRFKGWKSKLLRKAAFVLSEVARVKSRVAVSVAVARAGRELVCPILRRRQRPRTATR